jgi:hypothetical protein
MLLPYISSGVRLAASPYAPSQNRHAARTSLHAHSCCLQGNVCCHSSSYGVHPWFPGVTGLNTTAPKRTRASIQEQKRMAASTHGPAGCSKTAGVPFQHCSAASTLVTTPKPHQRRTSVSKGHCQKGPPGPKGAVEHKPLHNHASVGSRVGSGSRGKSRGTAVPTKLHAARGSGLAAAPTGMRNWSSCHETQCCSLLQ